jgi:hypothetical protein
MRNQRFGAKRFVGFLEDATRGRGKSGGVSSVEGGSSSHCRVRLRAVMPGHPVEMRVASRRSAYTTRFRALLFALLAVGLAVPARAGGSPGVLREVSLEGSNGTPRRAGASDPGVAVSPTSPTSPPSATYDVSKQNDLDLSRASMLTLPQDAVPVDVRMDVASFPDTTALGPARHAPGVHEEFRSGKTLVWCKSFLLSDLLTSAGGGAGPGEKMSVVAVEPLPGSPNVHHMHLHVCDQGSSAFSKHASLFEDDEKTPKTCLPPSWTPGSGCHGTAWTFLPGQEPVRFPEGVGFTVGGEDGDGDDLAVRRVVLEVHYDGADSLKGQTDASGLRLWATSDWEKDAKQRVGLLSVADPFARLPQNLPKGQKDVRYTTHCPPGCTKTFAEPMNVFASMTHAHLRARHVVTSVGTPDEHTGVVSEGDGPSTSGWRVVVAASDSAGAFSHDRQKFEPAEFVVNPGDALRTECRYDTRGALNSIPFGPATSQEMCMQVFLYYPKQREFLCGYYDETRFWCGDAEGFVERQGTDAAAFGETCEVLSSVDENVSDENRQSPTAGVRSESCAEAEARDAVVSEKNAHGEGVVMRR